MATAVQNVAAEVNSVRSYDRPRHVYAVALLLTLMFAWIQVSQRRANVSALQATSSSSGGKTATAWHQVQFHSARNEKGNDVLPLSSDAGNQNNATAPTETAGALPYASPGGQGTAVSSSPQTIAVELPTSKRDVILVKEDWRLRPPRLSVWQERRELAARVGLLIDPGIAASVAQQHSRVCTLLRKTNSDSGGAVVAVPVGFPTSGAAGWRRFWFVTYSKLPSCPAPAVNDPLTPPKLNTSCYVRTCRGGDALEVSLAGSDSKVLLDTIFDVENTGLYEAHIFLRRPGEFRLCTDVHLSFTAAVLGKDHQPPAGVWAGTPQRWLGSSWNYLAVSSWWVYSASGTLHLKKKTQDPMALVQQKVPPADWPEAAFAARNGPQSQAAWPQCRPDAKWSQKSCWIFRTKLAADDVTTILNFVDQQRQQATATFGVNCRHPDSFRSGEWRRLSQCDGKQCFGNLKDLSGGGNEDDDGGLSDVYNFQLSQLSATLNNTPSSSSFSSSPSSSSLISVASGYWVWVSDFCTVRIFSRRELWSAVGGHWGLAWGASTLKQPLANWLEYDIGVPIFPPFYMEFIHRHKGGGKSKPGFFSFREYEITRPAPPMSLGERPTPPTLTAAAGPSPTTTARFSFLPSNKQVISMSYLWGGCSNIMLAPSQCHQQTAMTNTDRLALFAHRRLVAAKLSHGAGESSGGGNSSGKKTAAEEQQAPLPILPTFVLLNHFIWRFPFWNETEVLAQIERAVYYLHETLVRGPATMTGLPKEAVDAVSNQPPPVIVWMTGVRRLHSDESRICSASHIGGFERRLVWRIEQLLQERFPYTAASSRDTVSAAAEGGGTSSPSNLKQSMLRPSVRILSRFELTEPFHTGDQYAHFGVHYGSTRGMCLTGVSHKDKYKLSQCLRRAFVDGMLQQMWGNAIAAHYDSYPPAPEV